MSLSAVLLAGGESRRMGRDKATIEWHGRALWELQLEKLRSLRPEKIFLSARTDASWRPSDMELIVDLPPSRGPLSGLAATLDATTTDHLFVLAVDMAFMTTEHLRSLCDRATTRVGVIPTMGEKAEPLCAIYTNEARPIFLRALQGDDFSLQPIVRKLVASNVVRVVAISDSDRKLYQSLNEPGDV